MPGIEAHHYFADVLHPGTIASGILANASVDASNADFGSGIARLSNAEILAVAIPVPAPAFAGSFLMVTAGLAMLGTRRRAA